MGLERRIGQTEVKEVPATIAARYKTATAQSFTSAAADAIVNYDTLEFDTHSRVTTGAAWKFTANVAGYYDVNAAILFASSTAWADTEAGYIALYKNGTIYCYLDRKDSYGSASSVFMFLHGSASIQLAATDYIDVRAFQNTGGALTLFNDSKFNYIDIRKR